MEIKKNNCDLYSSAMKIIRTLDREGYKSFFVGGCVRNAILGKKCLEIDLTTTATPDKINSLFSNTYNIGEAFGIVNVVIDGINFEVATMRTESCYADGRHPDEINYTDDPMEDAKRRDFTVNALFYDPLNHEILDFFDGLGDLKKGVLRSIGDVKCRFSEDYLRILRAIRIGTDLELKIQDDVFNACMLYSEKLKLLSVERIRDELNKMFMGSHPDEAFQMLYDTGILRSLLPELNCFAGVTQPKEYHPEGDVFEHVKLMLKNMTIRDVELVWSILLHDVGKPKTLAYDEYGNERFYCHDAVGAEIALKVLKRLKFSNKVCTNVSTAVKNHMRFGAALNMKKSKWIRIISDPTFPLQLELHRIDCKCSNGLIDNYLFFLDRLIDLDGITEPPLPFVSGKDLIKMGVSQGPLIGEILKELEELQLNNIIKDRDEALKYAKSFISAN